MWKMCWKREREAIQSLPGLRFARTACEPGTPDVVVSVSAHLLTQSSAQCWVVDIVGLSELAERVLASSEQIQLFDGPTVIAQAVRIAKDERICEAVESVEYKE